MRVGGWGRAARGQVDVGVGEPFPLPWPGAALLARSFLCLAEKTDRFNGYGRLWNLCLRRILGSPLGMLPEAEICGTGAVLQSGQFFCPSCIQDLLFPGAHFSSLGQS